MTDPRVLAVYAKDAAANLADWAEEEGGFDNADVDEQLAIVASAIEDLLAMALRAAA